MIRHIFIQLWNRRKANAWILVELMLVSCLLWYIMDYFFVLEYNKSLPSCRDLRHTWQIRVSLLPAEHPDYKAGESDSTTLEANYDRVLDRIRGYQDIESVAVLNSMAAPGGGGFWGSFCQNSQDTTRRSGGQMITFDPRTDFFKVFRYTTNDGKPVSAADFDWADPKSIVLGQQTWTSLAADDQKGPLIIDDVYGSKGFVVKGVVGDIKRFDYERPQETFYRVERVNSRNIWDMEIAVRVNEAVSDAQFQEAFKETMSRELRIGNFYLNGLKSYEQIHTETDYYFGVTGDIRIRKAMLLFFLVNIILCVMGTFWYRIRVRREEIGLRMAMGATRSAIRRMLFLEGGCLLTIAMVPALLIESQFVYLDLIDTLGQTKMDMAYLPDRTLLRFILTNSLTWLLMVVVITLAIWLPADKAAKMPPAEALHYE